LLSAVVIGLFIGIASLISAFLGGAPKAAAPGTLPNVEPSRSMSESDYAAIDQPISLIDDEVY
jgi:hypothetical protein